MKILEVSSYGDFGAAAYAEECRDLAADWEVAYASKGHTVDLDCKIPSFAPDDIRVNNAWTVSLTAYEYEDIDPDFIQWVRDRFLRSHDETDFRNFYVIEGD